MPHETAETLGRRGPCRHDSADKHSAIARDVTVGQVGAWQVTMSLWSRQPHSPGTAVALHRDGEMS